MYLDDTKLLNMLADRIAILEVTDLEKWCDRRNLVGFSEEKCEILHQGWSSPVQQYRLARKQVSRKGPWTWVDDKLNVGWQ